MVALTLRYASTPATYYIFINRTDANIASLTTGGSIMPKIADEKIRFAELTDGRLAKHDVGVIFDEPEAGKPCTATLFYGMSIVLVRTDQQGFVTKIEPGPDQCRRCSAHHAAIQYEFAVTLESA
jgi:hypothetical protein